MLEPENETADLKLIESTTRWSKFNDDAKGDVTDRLMEVVRKKSTTVIGKDGEADKNAISAAKVLITQEGQVQKDEHFEKRRLIPKLPSQTQVNVGVNIQNDSTEQNELRTTAHGLGIAWPPSPKDMPRVEAAHKQSRLDQIWTRLSLSGTSDHEDSEARVIGQPENE